MSANEDYDKVITKGTEAIENGDYKTAFNLILPYAESGDAEAQFAVALILGWGYSPDSANPSIAERESRSLMWIRKAAVQGHPQATDLLSDSYKNGWYGLAKNSELSECWASAANSTEVARRCDTMK